MIRRRSIRSGLTIFAMVLALAAPGVAQDEAISRKPRPGALRDAFTSWAASAAERFRAATQTLGAEGPSKVAVHRSYTRTVTPIDMVARTPRPRPEPDAALLPVAAPEDWLGPPMPPPAPNEAVPAPDLESPPKVAASPSYPDAASAIDTLARAPRPRPRPAPDSALLAMIAPDEPAEPPAPPPPPRVSTITDAEHAACLGRLTALGVAFTEEAPIDPTGSCNVDRPLSVSSVGSGIGIEPEAIMNCATAESLARWTAEIMLPAAKRLLDATPQILRGSTYDCRPRNNVAGEAQSEHAYANAVDIAAIAFADREPFEVRERSESEPEGKFQAAIREGSCSYFTTVLGPGSNAAHATHFHFDMAERGGGYRLCELGPAIASEAAPAPDVPAPTPAP